ncbi:S41 family peptidase [Massilia sp. W12]|uniref:S41 family peptidase n=1 Tax=Massilia sp. W12 TaxID=3126507 RepID=UPI0030CB9A62
MRNQFSRRLLAGLMLCLCWPALAGDGGLTPAQAAQEMRIVKRSLQALHPALTKYRSQAEIEQAFARFESAAQAAGDSSRMYLAVAQLSAFIRCSHTWPNVNNQQGGSKAALLGAANKLPFTLRLVQGRWLVLASAVPEVAAGDEIVALNGLSAPQIVAQMLPYLRADGASDAKRLQQLNHDRSDYSQMDMLWPLLSPPLAGRYRVQLRQPDSSVTRELEAPALTLQARAAALAKQGVSGPDSAWRFQIQGQTGYLTLPNFAFWNSKFDWAGFLRQSFAELQARQTPYLVIDIRQNEGGDGAIADALLSYLLKQPLQYSLQQNISQYERVPYNLVRYLDTWDYSFFDRTGEVEKLNSGTASGKYLVTARQGMHTITPQPRPYAGKVYLLISAENSSATFVLAKLSKQSGAATLVGQSTGGNLRGLNGGQLTWLTLPHSGVALDIPLLAGQYSADTPDAGIAPDVPVQRSFAAQRAGRDEEMEAVQRLIQAQGGN